VHLPASIEHLAPLLAQVAFVAVEVGIGRQGLDVQRLGAALELVAGFPVPAGQQVAAVIVELVEVVELDLRYLGRCRDALAADRLAIHGAGLERAVAIAALAVERRLAVSHAQQVVVVRPADAAEQPQSLFVRRVFRRG